MTAGRRAGNGKTNNNNNRPTTSPRGLLHTNRKFSESSEFLVARANGRPVEFFVTCPAADTTRFDRFKRPRVNVALLYDFYRFSSGRQRTHEPKYFSDSSVSTDFPSRVKCRTCAERYNTYFLRSPFANDHVLRGGGGIGQSGCIVKLSA